jgi:hypothetical protein
MDAIHLKPPSELMIYLLFFALRFSMFVLHNMCWKIFVVNLADHHQLLNRNRACQLSFVSCFFREEAVV